MAGRIGPTRFMGIVLAGAVVLGGCGSNAPTPSRTSAAAPSLPASPDPLRPLVVVTAEAGPTVFRDTHDPRIAVLYGDGTLAATDERRGAKLKAAAAVLGRPDQERAWAAVVGAGLAQNGSLTLEGLFDAGTTTFLVDDGVTVTTLSIYALGAGPVDGQSPFPAADLALRANAAAALATLRDLAGGQPYLPPALLLWSGAWDPGAAPAPAVPWTLPIDLAVAGAATPDVPVYGRCLLVEGELAQDVARFAASMPSDRQVELDGTRYDIGLRPIYPDEVGTVACPAG